VRRHQRLRRTLLVLALSPVATQALGQQENPVRVFGEGTISCGKWLQEREAKSISGAEAEAWIRGFLTGTNAASDDAVSSVGVMVAAAVMWLTGWSYADPLVSAAIGLFILPRTAKLMMDAVGVLLEGTPAEVNIGEVRRAIAAIHGVADVHDLHVWALTSGVNAISVHVVAKDSNDVGDLLTRVGQCATGHFKIAHVTVQVEPPGWTCGGGHS